LNGNTRAVFPLVKYFRSSPTQVSYPELSPILTSGKGDGEGGTSPQDIHGNSPDRDIPCIIPPTGGKKKSKAQVPTENACTVLSDYPEIDEVVLKLYDIFTRDPGISVQMQIDRYLFAASRKFVEQFGGDMRTCVLHAYTVPCIFNLPDLVYILRQRLVHGSWENALQETVCRYTIPGMQKSRWVTRQRKTTPSTGTEAEAGRCDEEATSTDNKYCFAGSGSNPDGSAGKRGPSLQSIPLVGRGSISEYTDSLLSGVYINTMLGLLLGLYPKCSKRPGFTMRVRIVRAVRVLLTSTIKEQTTFILQHVSLVRLAMVEYFANVLELYCPVEYKLLQNHVDVAAYINLCRSSCDLFRVNNLSEGVQELKHNKPLDWEMLDQLAYKMTDKIIRSTRVETKLINYVPVYHKSIKKMVSSPVYKQKKMCDEFLMFVKNCAVACWHDDHSYLYQRMLADESHSASNGVMASALDLNLVVSDVHSVLRTTMLPANFVRAQIETLSRLYCHDTVQLLVLSKKRICLHCLLRIAPKQFVLEEKINGNIRMDLNTDEVFCNRCMSDKHIISIDLIGRLLRINQQYLYICVECGAVHEWRADACDLYCCPLRPKQGLKLRLDLHQDTVVETTAKKTTTAKCRTHCFMCSKLCTGQGLWLLHVGSLRMIHFNLCSIHLPPLHMLQYIVDTGDYQRWLHNATSLISNGQRKKRRY